MKTRVMRYLFAISILLLVTLAATAVAVATSPWGPLAENQSPPPTPAPPTPGPPPTSVPRTTSLGEPVTNRDEAIRRALHIDSSLGTVREQPLTEAIIAANPDMIIVERYATRQEASDVYWGDGFGDPAIAAEPVWVVMIKGKATVRLPGGLGSRKELEANGITYEISQVDGQLLRISTGIPNKRINN